MTTGEAALRLEDYVAWLEMLGRSPLRSAQRFRSHRLLLLPTLARMKRLVAVLGA